MHAKKGDWLVVESTTLGGRRREGQIVDVRGPDGTPPYWVRWLADGRVTLCFPGPDAHVTPHGEHTARAEALR